MAVKISLIGRGVRVIIILVSIASNVILASEMNIPVEVNRRLDGDIYRYLNFPHEVCQDNLTYLVSEDRCVNDEELFNDCGFGFVSSEAPSNLTTALVFRDQNGNIFEQLKILVDSSDAAVTILNSKHQFVNGSFCQIASLEVYRGRDQIIEISHDGLSLSENGMVKVDPSSLSYNTSEYEGELYRMNLSCSGGELPESGCVFFKLRGITDLTYAKFNSTVKGSLNSLNASEQDINFDATTQSDTTTWTNAINTINSNATDFLSNTIATHFESVGNTDPTITFTPPTTNSTPSNSSTSPPIDFVDSTPTSTILVIIGPLVGGVTILISTAMVCVVVLLRKFNGRKNSISTTVAQPQNQDKSDTMKSQPSDCQRNPAYGHFGPTDRSLAALLSDNYGKNPAYNINAQPSAPQEPTYEIIQLGTDKIPQNVICSRNPAYIHLGVSVKESFRAAADATSPGDYSQNPAYGINSFKS